MIAALIVVVDVHGNGNATLIVIPTLDDGRLVDGRSIRITVEFTCTATATATASDHAHVDDQVHVHA